jgi:hypothetical protein
MISAHEVASQITFLQRSSLMWPIALCLFISGVLLPLARHNLAFMTMCFAALDLGLIYFGEIFRSSRAWLTGVTLFVIGGPLHVSLIDVEFRNQDSTSDPEDTEGFPALPCAVDA